MVNKVIFLLLIMIFSSSAGIAQKIDSQKTINCIKEGVVNFFIEINRLQNNNHINELYDDVGLIEISENKKLGYNLNGIYRITDFSSHRANYLLLKKGKQYKILSLLDLNSTLNDVTNFFKGLNFSKEEKIKYLELVIKEIKDNYNTQWLGSTKPKKQQWTYCN